MTTPQPRDHDDTSPDAGRPRVPVGYGLAPATEGALLPWSWATERLAASRNYWVATVRPSGAPHVTPVWGVWLDGAFYFGADPASRKSRNLQANPSAAVHLESGDEVVVLEGAVEPIPPDALPQVDAAFCAKYDVEMTLDGEGAKGYRLSPRVAFGWLESDYPNVATRWRFGGGG